MAGNRHTHTNSRKRRIITGAALLLLIIAAIIIWWGKDSAGKQAEEYEASFNAWNGQTRPKLLKATAVLPKGLYAFEKQSSPKSLTLQEKECDKIGETLSMLKRAADEVPELEGSLFAVLSDRYGRAQERSDQRKKLVQTYLENAQASYRQIQVDCRWSIKLNTAATESVTLYDTADKYVQKYGEAQGGSVCNSTGGCVPESDDKRKKYLDAYRRATESALKKIVPLLEPQECEKTSFASSCQNIHDHYKAVYGASLNFTKVTAKLATVISNRKIIDANKAYEKADAALDKAMAAAFKKQYPGFSRTTQLRTNPSQVDGWLDAVARARIQELVEKQAELKQL